MSTPVVLNGILYEIPTTGNTGWGNNLTNYLVAVGSGGLLSLSGGPFTLTSDTNFGPNFGLVSPYFKSTNANISSSGIFRLSNTDSVSWRNSANTADLPLTVVSDQLYFNGSPVGGGGGGGGSVNSFAFTNANGVSGVVTSPTSAPNLTLSLGAITPTSVNASGTIHGSNLSGSASGTNTGDQTITLTGDVSGSGTGSFATTLSTVSIAKGGTGQVTAAAAINALVPTQTSSAGKFLYTDGTSVSWQTPSGGGGGGVSAVSASSSQGVSVSVTNPTTTPLIAIGLGAITPTSVASTGTVTGTNISGSTTGTNTGDQTITLTGDVSGSGTGSFATTLSTSGVTAGSYTLTSLTVDAKGRIVAASNGALQTITLTGDVTGSGTGTFATTLAASGVTAGTYNNVSVSAKGIVYAGSNVAYLTQNDVITISGDASGSGRTAITLTLPSINSSVGTYAASTLNAKGQVTAGANLSGDITTSGSIATLAASGVTAGTYAVSTVNGKGLVTAGANLSGDITSAGAVTTLATVNANPYTYYASVITDPKGRVYAAADLSGDITTSGSVATLSNTTAVAGTYNYATINIDHKGRVWSATSNNVVSSFSFTNANGISGVVTSSTTTPNLTLSLGTISPLTVTASGTVTGSNLTGTHSGSSSGTNTGDQYIILTGDVTGASYGTMTTSLSTTGVGAGTYSNATITVDTKGRITSASTGPTVVGTSLAFGAITAIGNSVGSTISGGGTGLTAVGYNAAHSNTSGNYLVAIGDSALDTNTTGTQNIAVGSYALTSNVSGSNNTAVGSKALYFNTGNSNTAVGWQSSYNVTGTQNTSIGYGSLDTLTTGNNNVAIGWASHSSTATVSNEITLGNSSTATLRCQVTSITSLSDVRDKTDIQPLTYGLDFINDLKPVAFTWNMRDGAKVGVKSSGFIAQDLQQVQNEYQAAETLNLVMDTNPEKLEATYGHLIPVLVKAIQELKAEIDALKIQLNK